MRHSVIFHVFCTSRARAVTISMQAGAGGRLISHAEFTSPDESTNPHQNPRLPASKCKGAGCTSTHSSILRTATALCPIDYQLLDRFPASLPWACLPLDLLLCSCAQVDDFLPYHRQRAIASPHSSRSRPRDSLTFPSPKVIRKTPPSVQSKMFARRLAKSSSSLNTANHLTRAFTTSTPLLRSPALADITPEGVASFDAKQKEFRARVAAQAKKKPESSTSTSQATQTPTAPFVGNARKSNTVPTLIVGSQSSVETEPAVEEPGRKAGPISNLIYGTKEGREMEFELNNSFSQVLARGKYVHSIVFHEVKPDKVDEYVDLVGSWYPRMAGMPENKVHLVGSWRTEVGDCDTFGMFNLRYSGILHVMGL
jgi:hypothetical protein